MTIKGKVRKVFIIVSLLFVMVLMTGCWGNTEINQRAFVVGISIDEGKEKNYSLGIQYLDPRKLNPDMEKVDFRSSANLIFTEGNTIFEAVREQLKVMDKKPFFGDIQLIIISEEIAEKGFKEVFDFFVRDTEIATYPYVVVASGTSARSIIELNPKKDTISTQYITGELKISEQGSNFNYNIKLNNIIGEMQNLKMAGVIPAVNLHEVEEGEGLIKIESLALVSSGNVYKGIMSPKHTTAYSFLFESPKSKVFAMKNPLDENNYISLENNITKVSKKVAIIDDKVVGKIEINCQGFLAEQTCMIDLTTKQNIKLLEKSIEKKIKEDVSDTIRDLQINKETDAIGFSKLFYNKYPNQWHELEGRWDEVFSNMKIQVTINYKIIHTGNIDKPFVIN